MRTVPHAPDPARRAFVALPIPDDVRAALETVQQSLRGAGADAAWVHPADFHLTLAFLGDLPAPAAQDVAGALDLVASSSPPCLFRIDGVGAFGPPSSPQVVWAGVEPGAALLDLQRRVTEALKASGCAPDERPYAPHITLARIRGTRRVAELTSRMASSRSGIRREVRAARILLMCSMLEASSARYAVLHTAHLKGS